MYRMTHCICHTVIASPSYRRTGEQPVLTRYQSSPPCIVPTVNSTITWLLKYNLTNNVLATCMHALYAWWLKLVPGENWSLASTCADKLRSLIEILND
jgi:hypothetical protein